MKNALCEQLNVVVRTNTVRRALHEVDLGSLEKYVLLLLIAKNACYTFEFAQRHQDWSIHDRYRVIFSVETKINRF